MIESNKLKRLQQRVDDLTFSLRVAENVLAEHKRETGHSIKGYKEKWKHFKLKIKSRTNEAGK